MLKDEETVIREIADSNDAVEPPVYTAYGTNRPVEANRMPGRWNIIMTEWGPWDHETPLVRLARGDGALVRYDLYRLPWGYEITVEGRHVTGRLSHHEDPVGEAVYTVTTDEPGVHPYTVRLKAGDWKQEVRGILISAAWDVTFFKWTKATDPRDDIAAWRKLARGDDAVTGNLKQLTLRYGWSGPSEQKLSEGITGAKLGGDHFGMIARAQLPLSAGTWEFTTLSDDGVRVIVDGEPVIENWAWHGPTRNTGTLALREAKTVEIVVEHFEIDGYAVLDLGIAPKP